MTTTVKLHTEIECLRFERDGAREERDTLRLQLAAVTREVARLNSLINTPQTEDYFAAVRVEAAHQIERWGAEHDAGKRPEDWITLVVYLLGKAARAHFDGDLDKLKHHIVTVGAVALNWLRNVNGDSTVMRPGVARDSARFLDQHVEATTTEGSEEA